MSAPSSSAGSSSSGGSSGSSGSSGGSGSGGTSSSSSGGSSSGDSQPKCSQCKRAPINKKDGTCGNCQSKAYYSQACLQADHRRHRLDCPRLAFDYLEIRFDSVQRVGKALVDQGRYESADDFYRKLMAVGETSLGYRVGIEAALTNSAHRVGKVFYDAALPSRQLLGFAEATARVERGMAIYERVTDRGLRLQYRSKAHNFLGILLIDQGKLEEAEPHFRSALALNRDAQALYTRRPQDDWREDLPGIMAVITDSFLRVLHHNGKEEELRAVYNAQLRPVYVRQLLAPSGLKPTPARIEGFGVAQAMACPLPDLETAEACWQFAFCEIMTERAPLQLFMPLRLRLLNRFRALGTTEANLATCARIMLVDHKDELPHVDLVLLYHLQADHPRIPGDVTTRCDPASLTGHVARRLAKEGLRTGDRRLYAEGCQLLFKAAAEAEAVGKPYPGLVMHLGELGHMLVCEGQATKAKEVFERALAAAKGVWGEELLGNGMDCWNHPWLSAYLELLEEDEGKDEAAALRRRWLGLVQAELEGRDEQLSDAALAEIRAAMRRARGATADGEGMEDGVGMGRRARLRQAARRHAAEAPRLKRAKASARREEAATRAAADRPGPAAMTEKQEQDRNEEDEEDLNECSICLMKLAGAGREEETLQCQHTFHTRCIAEWKSTCLRKALTVVCPYCRASI